MARRWRRYGAILRGYIHGAIERCDDDGGILDALAEALANAADLTLTGQKRKDRTWLGAQRLEDGLAHLIFDAARAIATNVARFNREGAPVALDHWCITQQACHPRALKRRRHDEDAQVRAQPGLRIKGKG